MTFQVVVAVFPFRFDPPRTVDNDVSRTVDGGLRFGVHNHAETAEAPPWLRAARSGRTVTVDLVARAARDDAVGPARILTVSDGFYRGDLTIGQQRGDLVVRVRRSGADQAGWPDLFGPGAFREPTWVAVQVVVAPDRILVRVDGREAIRIDTTTPPTARWNAGFRLALGNELGGGRPWEGALRRADVTVGATTYDYLRPGALEIPRTFRYEPHRPWEPVLPDTWTDLAVGLLHLVLYVPLGMLLVVVRPRLPIRWVLAAAVMLSLAVTVLKTLFAARHPSFADVVWQSAGALAGAMLAGAVLDRKPHHGVAPDLSGEQQFPVAGWHTTTRR